MRIRTELIPVMLLSALIAAAPQLDGATILNSGSTNTAGYTIKIFSDGSGTVQLRGGQPAAFTISTRAAERFFADVRAARASGGSPLQHCMKSASFGTRTIVQWHGWTSPDLQCPPFTAPVGALAQEVSAIQSAAHVTTGSLLHRVPLPIEMRKIPTPTPEVSPT